MSRIPAFALLRRAGWALSLLVLASLGGVSPGTAGPEQADSSLYPLPVKVLAEVHRPAPTPAPTPSPTPRTTPTPSHTPKPPPSPSPTPAPPPPAPPSPSPPPPTPAPTPPPPEPPRPSDSAAAAVLAHTNELRAAYGLPPLGSSPALNSAAADYARVLAVNDWFSHVGPDGSTLVSRAEAAGYVGWTHLAENLYRGFYGDPPAGIIQAWTASPSHLSAMLSDAATEIGVGCAVVGEFRWCVQDFGAR